MALKQQQCFLVKYAQFIEYNCYRQIP